MSHPGIMFSGDMVEGSCRRDIASVKNEKVGIVADLPSYANTTCLGIGSCFFVSNFFEFNHEWLACHNS